MYLTYTSLYGPLELPIPTTKVPSDCNAKLCMNPYPVKLIVFSSLPVVTSQMCTSSLGVSPISRCPSLSYTASVEQKSSPKSGLCWFDHL